MGCGVKNARIPQYGESLREQGHRYLAAGAHLQITANPSVSVSLALKKRKGLISARPAVTLGCAHCLLACVWRAAPWAVPRTPPGLSSWGGDDGSGDDEASCPFWTAPGSPCDVPELAGALQEQREAVEVTPPTCQETDGAGAGVSRAQSHMVRVVVTFTALLSVT